MFDGYIKIPHSRLLAGRPLARAIFLAMPKNGKLLRLAGPEGELSEEILRRTGSCEIFVRPEPGESAQPEKIRLYMGQESEAKVASGHFLSEEDAPAEANGTAEGAAASLVPAGNTAPDEETAFAAAPPGTDTVQKFGPAGVDEEAAQSFGGKKGEDDFVRRFAAGEASGSDDTVKTVKSLGQANDAGSAASAAGVPETESAWGIPRSGSAFAGSETGNAGPGETPANLTERIATIGHSLSDEISRFQAAADASGIEDLKRLASMLDSAGEAFLLFGDDPDPARDPALPGLARALDSCLIAIKGLAAQGRENVLSASPGLARALGDASGVVLSVLPEPLPDFALSAEDAQKEEEWLFNNTSSTKSPAGATLASVVLRETPQIAARLAAQLGHSLGYSSLGFLTDLALSAIVRFSAKAGARIENDALPPLARAALAQGGAFAEGGVEDSLWILALLETYFENPACDRTQKDFSKRVFEIALTTLEGTEQRPDPFVAARWRQFIGRGPTATALSASSRASSRASKAAKNLVSKFPDPPSTLKEAG